VQKNRFFLLKIPNSNWGLSRSREKGNNVFTNTFYGLNVQQVEIKRSVTP